jgi:hypothetical protein
VAHNAGALAQCPPLSQVLSDWSWFSGARSEAGVRRANMDLPQGCRQMMREALGVDAQLLGGGTFPVIGAQHGADVVEVVGDAVA